MSVSNLDDYRPHRSGQAKCCHCKHIWDAVAPVDAGNLECPNCGLFRGVWYGIHLLPESTSVFTCNCSNTFFELSPEGPLCIDCGHRHDWSDL